MQVESTAEFKGWRSFFWPIHRWELKKFLPMLFIYFLISFNYNALRAYKDTMVVTATNSGAEALPFIKVWAILPAAFLLTYLFTRLSNKFSREKVFYIMIGIFLSFFVLFAFFLFPAQEYLHPNEFADKIQASLPTGFKGFIAVFRNWTFTLFYVMSELWSTAIMSVLFWGFANDVMKVHEAKRFYILWSIGANVAGIFAGKAAIFFSGGKFFPWIPYGKDAWDQSVLFLCMALIVSSLVIVAIFRWMNKYAIEPSEKTESDEPVKEKVKMSMRKNFAYLAQSKYLLCIALIVLCYNLSINLVEVVWKNQIRQIHPNSVDYNVYMGEVMVWMGTIATIISVLFTGNVVRRLSWTASALVTPVIALLAGTAFFVFVLFNETGAALYPFLATANPLLLSVFMGSVHNCTTRACKYTLYDATKEIAFIPLSSESKLKGKAAIDGVGSRLGKSGGSVIHAGLLMFLSTVSACAPYVAAIFIIVTMVWMLATVSLGKQFDALTADKSKLDIPDQDLSEKKLLSTSRS